MATALAHNPGDVFIQLRSDEYNALVSLLHELQDEETLKNFVDSMGVELSPGQCSRVSKLWGMLVQNRS